MYLSILNRYRDTSLAFFPVEDSMKHVTTTMRYPALILAGLALLFTAGVVSGWITLSGDYSITRRVVGVPYEGALAEYCEVLQGLDGVTEVDYKNYDPLAGSALVTVHYNPEITSPKIIMVWLGNTKSIWQEPVIA